MNRGAGHPFRLFPASYRYRKEDDQLQTDLASNLRARRPEAIADLLDEFGREIQGVAYLILRNHADAEDVVMETLATAWRRSNTLRDDRALRSWLLSIASRRALSSRRRRRATLPLEAALPALASDIDMESTDRIAIREAMADLPTRMRAAIALHYFADLTVAETAAALGRSENTIKSQLRKGMSRLRGTLDAPATNPRRNQTDAEQI